MFCVQGGCEGVDFLLQLCNAAVGFLLSFSTGRSDDALSFGLGTSFAGCIRILRILVATDLESATGLAGTRSLWVVCVMTVAA